MSAKPLPQALALREAMDQSEPLALLARRLKESNARFETVREQLPPGLRAQVKPGPVDDEGWSLLAANAAVAAKLRHLVPLLQHALLQQGWKALTIRVKITGAGR